MRPGATPVPKRDRSHDDRWRVVRPGAVVPRPPGVMWAAVPGTSLTATGGGPCQVQAHDVYLARRPLGTQPGCQGNDRARDFWVCAVCTPIDGPRSNGMVEPAPGRTAEAGPDREPEAEAEAEAEADTPDQTEHADKTVRELSGT